MSGKVYVVQEPMVMRNGSPVRRFSMEPAEAFGEVIFVLNWTDTIGLGLTPGSENKLLWMLRRRLEEFTDKDYLLMTGNWTAMAMAVFVVLERTAGFLNCLQWDREESEYRVIEFDMNLDEPEMEDWNKNE